jgi:hypothetical protein
MAFLTRTDPTRNINRFYIVDVTPTMFGEWAVVRECDPKHQPVLHRRRHADAVRRMGTGPRVGPARLAWNRAAQQLPAPQ